MSAEDLRRKADRCRNLAAGINDDEMITRLLALAEDYDDQARHGAPAAVGPDPCNPILE